MSVLSPVEQRQLHITLALGFNLAITILAIGYDQALDLFSIAHLNTLLHLQLRPINLVVYKESYSILAYRWDI